MVSLVKVKLTETLATLLGTRFNCTSTTGCFCKSISRAFTIASLKALDVNMEDRIGLDML